MARYYFYAEQVEDIGIEFGERHGEASAVDGTFDTGLDYSEYNAGLRAADAVFPKCFDRTGDLAGLLVSTFDHAFCEAQAWALVSA